MPSLRYGRMTLMDVTCPVRTQCSSSSSLGVSAPRSAHFDQGVADDLFVAGLRQKRHVRPDDEMVVIHLQRVVLGEVCEVRALQRGEVVNLPVKGEAQTVARRTEIITV